MKIGLDIDRSVIVFTETNKAVIAEIVMDIHSKTKVY